MSAVTKVCPVRQEHNENCKMQFASSLPGRTNLLLNFARAKPYDSGALIEPNVVV